MVPLGVSCWLHVTDLLLLKGLGGGGCPTRPHLSIFCFITMLFSIIVPSDGPPLLRIIKILATVLRF